MAVLPASPGTFGIFSSLLVVMASIVAIFTQIAQYEIAFQCSMMLYSLRKATFLR
jgi:hypothetical protein